jgi:UDP-N-acetylglucosamine 1-carboxyvinyltransferase
VSATAPVLSIPRLEYPMDKFVIQGGARLDGAVEVSLAKNAVLPMMAAANHTEGPCVLRNVGAPRRLDHGVGARHPRRGRRAGGSVLHLDATGCSSVEAPYGW